jgi:hypothetical protein
VPQPPADRQDDANDLVGTIGAAAPGTVVKIGTHRNGSDSTVSVTLGELPVTPFKAAAAPPGSRERRGRRE